MKTKTIGERIKEILEIRDMKPIDLANKSDVSQSLISMIMNNQRTSITIDTLMKLAKALGINAAYLLEDNVIGPAELFPHMTEEQRNFILNQGNLPWLQLTQEAYEKGISPEKLRQLIKIMSE